MVKVRVITYFSLYSVDVQCEVFAILTPCCGQGAAPGAAADGDNGHAGGTGAAGGGESVAPGVRFVRLAC